MTEAGPEVDPGTDVGPAAGDDVSYVDDRLYDDVVAFYRANAGWTGSALPADASWPEVAPVLQEARALDARDYERWLGLYGPRCLYWVPRAETVGDPRTEPCLHFDDHRRLSDRVALIRTGHLHAQIPPTRTCRTVANVELRPAGRGRKFADVHSTLVVHAYRRRSMEQYVGRQFHRVELTEGGWRIKYRVLLLVDRDGPQGNTSFIL